MIREHEDDWEQWLVPALSESDGAEMRTRAVGETGVSVEERVLRSSLRSIKREERDGVAALFLFASVFPLSPCTKLIFIRSVLLISKTRPDYR